MKRSGINREVAFAGKRVKQKVVFALTLSSVIPLLLLTYAFQAPLRALLGPLGHLAEAFAGPAVVAFTALLMIGGGIVVWDIATAVSRAANLTTVKRASELPVAQARQDEIGALMEAFSRLLTTIEQQTEQINQFPHRLDQLSREAFRDPLTGLPNRALFMDRLSHALTRTERRGGQLGVLFLDLDRFKSVNDSLGHGVGDQLLVEAGRRLSACLRPEDTIARLGGDEFAILLEDAQDVGAATSVAERIATALQRPFLFDARPVAVSASIGIALSAGRPMRPEDVLRNADLAMYQAKAEGRARYELFSSSLAMPSRDRLELQSDLRRAGEQRELSLRYQPVVDLATRRIVEVEALIRWDHRRRGAMLPAEFLPISEETGLIVPMGRWVLEEACRQARRWQAAYSSDPPLVISVNLGAGELRQSDLAGEIAAVLRETGLPPATLKLEMSERVLAGDQAAALDILEALRGLGVQLAVDDFGTGPASLGYLKRLPVGTLKIDRSLVRGLGQDAEDAAIVRALITVAKGLHMIVTAEGVESGDQLARLLALGCDRGQGYYFARPVAAERIPDLFDAFPTGGEPSGEPSGTPTQRTLHAPDQ